MTKPPTSSGPVTPATLPSKCPWTILGRLSKAVRDIWFAVGLEVLVVIGFQITAWGKEGDLRDREAVSRAASRYEVALDELGGLNLICLSRQAL